MFIVIDGGDGTGKSTQLALLKQRLESMGRNVMAVRDPGSTALGEMVRNILLDSQEVAISDTSEMLLFMAARAQMLQEQIRPALAENRVVLADRFLLSTVVYQGYAAGLPVEDIWSVGKIVLGNCVPDANIVLDLNTDTALTRIDRPLDRMELKGKEYHQRVQKGFLLAAEEWTRRFPGRCELVSAADSPEIVAGKIWEIVETL